MQMNFATEGKAGSFSRFHFILQICLLSTFDDIGWWGGADSGKLDVRVDLKNTGQDLGDWQLLH